MCSKGGVLKALIGLLKIAECRFSSIIEDPQRPNHSYSLSFRCLAALWFVDDEGIGLQLFGQANRFGVHPHQEKPAQHRERQRLFALPASLDAKPPTP